MGFSTSFIFFVYYGILEPSLLSVNAEILATGHSSVNVIQPRASSSPELLDLANRAHGVTMALTVTLILPLGALVWRLIPGVLAPRTLLRIHICCQVLGLAMLAVGFGLGTWTAVLHNELYINDPYHHTVIGTVVLGLFLLQPMIGTYQHRIYKAAVAKGSAETSRILSLFRSGHRWFGRLILVLAIVNGGLGLQLAANTVAGLKVYGIVAGVVGAIYLAALVIWWAGERHESRRDKNP